MMHTSPRSERYGFRSVFVSDIHLGCRFAQADRFLNFLESHSPDHLYLVGDFIDGWRLKRRWHWQGVYDRIFHRLMALAAQGTRIYYTPGNHDEFLRDYAYDFGWVKIANEFLHETADGRRFVVLHGDRFDDVEVRAPWLSFIGGIAYDAIVGLNGMVNRYRQKLKLPDCQFSPKLKQYAKQAVMFVSDFEERLVHHARSLDACGVICGHIHTPCLRHSGDVLYGNTGDWVEHCTALVEYHDGALQLLHDLGTDRPLLIHSPSRIRRPRVCSRPDLGVAFAESTGSVT